MQKYGALCLEPVQDCDAVKVEALRERLHLSQAVLASLLNTSVSTVRKWEVGDKRPSGPSQKLLDIIERKGLEAVL
jgi:putative transcriptional regulator